MTDRAADKSSRNSYKDGTKAQYSQFLDHMVRSRAAANGASSDQEAKVLSQP
ncbi:hypothetical protein HAP48_0048895 [Bradyrhizobium septentrionale]|uniref:Uncharacterized protein n=1 Tax=Bradyrhizobium septentrionale TaxID=1404411 RepID=A0A974A4D8_9BRAD|nr:hypothetical protein [Bradyrhizobium septentrionale]UGY16305.1 hypothetical protein HAP48_0048895 [Bradyrhizobium septentrionale]UGY24933.1 hypothetical protein HU675_0044890 [Bradyrhizobium septentrionale]